MTLVKRNYAPTPFSGLLNDFFADDDFFGRSWNRNTPAVNVKEEDDAYHIEVVAPGYQKGDFNVEVDEGMLKISAHHEAQTNNDDERYSIKEYHRASFERSFRLPEEKVNVEKIKGKYEDGILIIQLPKKEEKKSLKKLISIG